MHKKILFLVNHDLVIYNFRKELVKSLIDKGYEVFISSPYGKKIDYLVELGCIFLDTKINRHGINIIQDLKLLFFYTKAIKKINPSFVLTYTIKPNIYGGIASKKLKVPYITNITGLGTAVGGKGVLKKITILMYKVALSRADTVFFQNDENMEFFLKHRISFKNNILIPGSGVNVDEFKYHQYNKSEIIHFAFISRIMKEKGIDYYLEAASFIKQKYPNTVFHVCGFCEGNYHNVLESFEKKGVIVYHGNVPDIRNILSNIHCVIHPSYYPEGISNVLLEAAATGNAIITTNHSGCRETVIEDVSGYIVPVKNTNLLIKKIIQYLDLSPIQKKEMGIQGRQHIEKNFDRKVVVNEYLKAIGEIS